MGSLLRFPAGLLRLSGRLPPPEGRLSVRPCHSSRVTLQHAEGPSPQEPRVSMQETMHASLSYPQACVSTGFAAL
jgi:hypothetical protein